MFIYSIYLLSKIELKLRDRTVQWHYIDKLTNDTVPNHTLITTNLQALFIYNRDKITGLLFPVLPLKTVLPCTCSTVPLNSSMISGAS